MGGFQNPIFTGSENRQNHCFYELFGSIHFLRKKTHKKIPHHLVAGVALFNRAAGRGLGPCSGCPSCPLLRSPSGRGFFVLSLTEGAGFVASRVAWVSGSEPPPAVTTPVTRVWQVKIPCLSTEKPCGGFALHFYTAANGFGPFYSVTMVDDLSVTRWWFQRPTCARGGQVNPAGFGFPLPLCL